jgi:Na+-driven multidrug efflux pump
MTLEPIINAAFIGLGSGIGSYFGAKIARQSEERMKSIINGGKGNAD